MNNVNPGFPPADVWHTVDLRQQGLTTAQVQAARWAGIGGIAIITHGTNPQQCNLTLTVRAYGSTLAGADDIVQAIEPHVGGGVRSSFFVTTPVVDGKFQWQWRGDLPGSSRPNYGA